MPTCYIVFFFFLMIRRPPRSTLDRSSAASDVYKRQVDYNKNVSFQIPEGGPGIEINCEAFNQAVDIKPGNGEEEFEEEL